jgi:SAM-dependent methyltransferase
MSNSIERFSNRVENYVKYRPDYPREIIGLIKRECGLSPSTAVADVGCGTGISTRMFLENGNRVYGVEPNSAMRAAAIKYLSGFPQFVPVDGTAEATTLPQGAVDMVVAAQAFHWFAPQKTREEFLRILRPGGHIVLIWNERSVDADAFHRGYEALLVKYASDYGNVRHDNITRFELDSFFPKGYKEAVFENSQEFDFDGLKGRMLSASYMPSEDDERFGDVTSELRILFANHAETGRIKVSYSTKVYFSPC